MKMYECPLCHEKELAVQSDQDPTVFVNERGNVIGGDDSGAYTWSERSEAHCPELCCGWVGRLKDARLAVMIERHLRIKLEKDLATEERAYAIHQAIAGVLKDFVGKKLTKRFTDKVTAAVTPLFSTPPVCFYPHPGQLNIWHTPSIPYDQREIYFIAGSPSAYNPNHSAAHPTLEGFEYEDQSHGTAAVERITQRRVLLAEGNPTLAKIARQVEAIRHAKAALHDLTDELDRGVRHEAERLADERSAS